MKTFTVIFFLILIACSAQKQPSTTTKIIPKSLPYAVSNHAVAQTTYQDEDQFFVFNGLTNLVSKGQKTFKDITNQAWVWRQGQWLALPIPQNQPAVLASVAASVNNQVYLFGGYTVAEDHSEKSSPLVWQIDGRTLEWQAMTPMPTPVDDAVALVYQDRYIYLVSGWHDVDNVDLVQVFDSKENIWQQATAFPLPAVFGHAGGLVDNQMIVCDGVKVQYDAQNKKQFLPSPECAIGTIDSQDVTKIQWHKIKHHSGTAYYRMAAAAENGHAIFAGGSDNPYNFNGIGYDGVPSGASDTVRTFDFKSHIWKTYNNNIPHSMDHRGLLFSQGEFIILGGMKANQKMSSQVISFKINTP